MILHDGGADTFQFTNKDGRNAQVNDRNGVKELLQNLLPKFRIKINSELEEKNRFVSFTLSHLKVILSYEQFNPTCSKPN